MEGGAASCGVGSAHETPSSGERPEQVACLSMATTLHAIEGRDLKMKFFNKRAALGLLVLGSVLPLTFAASAVAAQAPVPLGNAGSFAILAGSGITNVPTSVIRGDVGLSPTTGAAITGLGCVEVTRHDLQGRCSRRCLLHQQPGPAHDHQERPGQCIRQRHGADADPGHHRRQPFRTDVRGRGLQCVRRHPDQRRRAADTERWRQRRRGLHLPGRSRSEPERRRHVERDLHERRPALQRLLEGQFGLPVEHRLLVCRDDPRPATDHAHDQHHRRGQAPGSQRQRDVDQRHDHAALDVRHAG